MKANKFAVTVLIILALLIFANSLYIERTTENFINDVELVDISSPESAKEKFEKLFASFKKAERVISITVGHDDLTHIEENFADIIGAARADDKDGLITTKSRLIDSLGHLRRLSGVSLDSII